MAHMKFVALGPWSCQSCLYNMYQLVVFVFCLNLTKSAEQFTSCQVTPASLLENKNHGCSTHAKVKEPTTENVRNQELLVYLPSIRQEIRNASVQCPPTMTTTKITVGVEPSDLPPPRAQQLSHTKSFSNKSFVGIFTLCLVRERISLRSACTLFTACRSRMSSSA